MSAFAAGLRLLGGLMVPVSLLPGWLQTISRVIFLSWGSDLLRSSLRSGPVAGAGGKLLALAVTAAAVAAIGQAMLGTVLRRARVAGTMSLR
jgi:ABC-2 type transport system permease protein